MSIQVKSPFPIYTDIDGDPLEAGFIFIGEPGLNPLSSPLQAYWDSALTVPASNIRTKGGYPSNNGTPGQLFVDSDYSFLLQDKKGAQVLYTAYSRDTPLIYETELRTFSDNDIIVPSLVHLDGVLDTSLGDALFTLDPGKFEGQQVHLIADGTGIAELTGGNGIYVNSIFITENTGGAHLKWTNSQWVAVNEVTADYADGTQAIEQTANGGLYIGIRDGNDTAVTTARASLFSSGTFTPTTLSIPFLGSPLGSAKLISQNEANFAWSESRFLATTTQGETMRILSTTSIASLTYAKVEEYRGKY